MTGGCSFCSALCLAERVLRVDSLVWVLVWVLVESFLVLTHATHIAQSKIALSGVTRANLVSVFCLEFFFFIFSWSLIERSFRCLFCYCVKIATALDVGGFISYHRVPMIFLVQPVIIPLPYSDTVGLVVMCWVLVGCVSPLVPPTARSDSEARSG